MSMRQAALDVIAAFEHEGEAYRLSDAIDRLRTAIAADTVEVSHWKMRRAANIIECAGDEHGVGRDLRAMIAAATQEKKP